ncbi:MAG TPA: hypothetical protein VJ672_07625, partial [Gemmatimonadaceae bacterium]|nr:hypothetical protein [Gemmatimonadaceae bacterium]
ARLAPGSMFPYFYAVGTFSRGFDRRALELLLAIDSDRGWMKGWFTYWPIRGMVRHMLGEHDAEAADAELASRKFPGNAAAITSRVRALTVLGRRDEVERQLDQALLVPASAGWTAGSAIGVAAQEAAAHGHADWLPELRRRALEWYAGLSEKDREFEAPNFGHSWVLYSVGAWPRLAERLDRLEREIQPRPELLAYQAMVAIRRGDRARALAIDSALRTTFSMEKASNTMERFRAGEAIYRSAQVAAALGDRPRALELLRRGLAGGAVPRFYLHCDPAFSELRSDPEFRQLFASRG